MSNQANEQNNGQDSKLVQLITLITGKAPTLAEIQRLLAIAGAMHVDPNETTFMILSVLEGYSTLYKDLPIAARKNVGIILTEIIEAVEEQKNAAKMQMNTAVAEAQMTLAKAVETKILPLTAKAVAETTKNEIGKITQNMGQGMLLIGFFVAFITLFAAFIVGSFWGNTAWREILLLSGKQVVKVPGMTNMVELSDVVAGIFFRVTGLGFATSILFGGMWLVKTGEDKTLRIIGWSMCVVWVILFLAFLAYWTYWALRLRS